MDSIFSEISRTVLRNSHDIASEMGYNYVGSEHILAGIIREGNSNAALALAGQGIEAEKAAVAGVYLHGLAGDICAEELGEYSVIATDVIAAIPKAVKTVMR